MHSHALIAEDIEVAGPVSGKLYNQQEGEYSESKIKSKKLSKTFTKLYISRNVLKLGVGGGRSVEKHTLNFTNVCSLEHALQCCRRI